MEEFVAKRFAVIERYNNNYTLLVAGSEEDIDNCLTIVNELCAGVSDVRKVDITGLNINIKGCSSAELENIFSKLF